MKKFHIDRLEKLHAFLGTVKPKKFFFGSWATDQNDIYRKPDLNVCGTTACALGWAGSMPEFRKRGLKLKWSDDNSMGWVELSNKDGGEPLMSEYAGAEFFGLSNHEADELFIPSFSNGQDRTPLPKYRRKLRKFIDRKRRELKIPA